MKRMMTFVGILIAFLAVAFFQESGPLSAQSKPRVGVLTLMHHPALDQIQKGVTAGLAERDIIMAKIFKLIIKMPKGIRVI